MNNRPLWGTAHSGRACRCGHLGREHANYALACDYCGCLVFRDVKPFPTSLPPVYSGWTMHFRRARPPQPLPTYGPDFTAPPWAEPLE